MSEGVRNQLLQDLRAGSRTESVLGFGSGTWKNYCLFGFVKFPKALLLATICVCVISGNAQYNADFLNYNKTGRSVSANLEFEAGSSGMSSEFVNKLVWGGYIDNDLKMRSSRHLKERNNFGLMLNYDVNAFVKGNGKFDFLIGFKNQEVLNAAYTRDFFNLMFYGNQMYKGKTADLSHVNVNALRFQEIKFGAIMHQVDSIGKIGISVSFINGEQLFYIKTNAKSNLYTSVDGGELVFNSNFSMALSDTGNKHLGAFNGIGASADLFFETNYKARFGKKCMLTVNANNIGFIHWRKNSVQYSSHDSLRYNGYSITSIADLRDSTINRINRDTLLRDLANARHENFNVNIPTNLVIINRIYFSDKFCLGTGFRYIFNANYRPYFFIEPELSYKNISFCLHTGYGGYVSVNIGASVTYNSKSWFVRAGSNSLQGYILPGTAFGQGVFLSVAKKLK